MKAIFLDRDGVINRHPGDFKYVASWKKFRFLKGVKPGLGELSQAGYLLFIISNQAGVSQGIYSQDTLDEITAKMLGQLQKAGALFQAVYYCIHKKEENCGCRKPKPGLIKKAIKEAKEFGIKISPQKSYFIGDTQRDIQAGKSAGLRTILVFSGKEKPGNQKLWKIKPDFYAKDILTAVKIILKTK